MTINDLIFRLIEFFVEYGNKGVVHWITDEGFVHIANIELDNNEVYINLEHYNNIYNFWDFPCYVRNIIWKLLKIRLHNKNINVNFRIKANPEYGDNDKISIINNVNPFNYKGTILCELI